MDFDLFLTSPRWEILQIIAEKPSSPVEIAKKIKTTVSYVSQQLKLLDAANLVTKEKTGAFEKGKPRTLFGLSNELIYLTALTKKFSDKKLFYITDYHRTIIQIWLSIDPALHYYAEKVFWKLEEDISDIEGIFIDITEQKQKILVVSESKKIKQKIEGFEKFLDKKIEVLLISKNLLKKFSSNNLRSIHDPLKLIGETKNE